MTLAHYYPTNIMGKKAQFFYGIYVSHPANDRFTYQKLATIWAAKHFVNLMIDGDDWKWTKREIARGIPSTTQITTARGINIWFPEIEDVMEYEFSKEERDFVFPEPDYSTWARFPRLGKQGPALMTEEDYNAGTASPADKPKRQRRTPEEREALKQEKEARKQKPSREGLTSVQDIAATLKVDPKHARAALRKASEPKPDAGWAWPSSEVKRITKLIKDNLK